MREEDSPLVLSRRRLLALVGAGMTAWGRLYAYGANFWNTKEPGEWSPEEIKKLLTKSPWAKEVAAERITSKKSLAGPADTMGLPPPSGKNKARKMPGVDSAAPKTKSAKIIAEYRGKVVWVSAEPVRVALKAPLPAEFADHHVLAVNGIELVRPELSDDGSEDSATALKAVTSLKPKGKGLVQPEIVQQQAGNEYLFGFSREALQLTKDDKEVTFETKRGKLTFTTKFNPKEMLYHGELAV